MQNLNMADLRIDGGTQKRDELDTKKVHEFAELMTDGIKFPPVTVFFDGLHYWLSAGFHRYFAHKQNKAEQIECEVMEGTLSQAIWYSYGSNNHGTPHTLAERKRHALEILLNEEYSKQSARQICQHIGLHFNTFQKIKDKLGVKKPDVVTYTTKKGVTRTRKSSTTINKNPDVTNVTPEDKTVKELEVVQQQVKELNDTVIAMDAENIKLKDILSTKTTDLSEFEQIVALDTIDELREKIKQLELEVQSLRDSRDMFQSRNAELIRELKSFQRKK
jgi:FtsZ-binding cell division protein ZapB